MWIRCSFSDPTSQSSSTPSRSPCFSSGFEPSMCNLALPDTHTHTQSNTYDIHKRGKPRPNSNSAEFLFPNYKWTIGRRRGVTGTISPRLPDRRKRSHAIRIEPGLAGLLDHAIAQFAVANRGATEASWELPNLSSDLVSWHTFQANMCQPIVHGELPQSHYVCSVLWISCWLERLMARSPS